MLHIHILIVYTHSLPFLNIVCVTLCGAEMGVCVCYEISLKVTVVLKIPHTLFTLSICVHIAITLLPLKVT